MNKPRILIIENSIAITGALKSIIGSSSSLRDQFDFIFLLPLKSKATRHVNANEFTSHEFPMLEISRSMISLIFYFPVLIINTIRLFRLIRKEKINLIHNNDFYNLMPSLYKLLGGSTPYISCVRFLPSKFPRQIVKIWNSLHGKLATKIIAVSNAVRNELPHGHNVTMIYNQLPRLEVPYQRSLSTIILYPANYIKGKGQEFALESFARIYKTYPAWKLHFIGGDMGLMKNRIYKNYLKERAKELNIADHVQWKDFTFSMTTEYLKAGIVINFSESESFSLTCMEAMYCGRAVIATRCGGPEEIIDNNQTGLLVPVADVEAMAVALDFLISKHEARELLAHNAYFSVRDRFQEKNTTLRLEKVYLESLKRDIEG